MCAQALDLLFLTGEADVRWFTGFRTAFWQSPTRPWFLLVPGAGEPVAVIPAIGEACMRRTWLADIRTWASPDVEDDGVGLLVETIGELTGSVASAPARSGASRGIRIGVPMGQGTSLRMPLADHERLRSLVPGCRWHDATGLLNALRAIKSNAEIDRMRFVCQAASRAFDAMPEIIAPRMRDDEVFRAFTIRCLEEGVDEVAYLVGGAGSNGYGDIISPPSGRRLRSGDVLMLDTGCHYDGNYCDFDRNWAIGEVDRTVDTAYRIAWDATEAGLAAAGPGLRCEELFEVMHVIMAPYAVDTPKDARARAAGAGRLGHGLGIQLTEPPSIMPGDRTVLRPGMVVTLEPGFQFAPGKVMVHEENLAITEAGCELLSHRAPARMPRIEADR